MDIRTDDRTPAGVTQSALYALCIALFSFHAACADIVYLKTGGVMRGLIKTADDSTEKTSVTMSLLSGAEVKLIVEHISSRQLRPLKFEEYEVRAESLPDTLKAHWELAEWCREQKLDEQREIHLEIVLVIDPKHRQAHYGLRHTFYREQWMTREEYDQTRIADGFVKYKGKWVRADKLESVKSDDAATKAEREWYAKVRIWLNWATGNHPERAADGLNNLREISDPKAVSALVQFLGKSQRADVRRLFIEITGKIEGPVPVVPLATLSVREDVRELRELALTMIDETHYDQARQLVIDELRDRNNIVVRRAGTVLAKIGDETSAPALIRALVTTHSYKVRVPVQGYSFGVDGSIPSGSGLPPEIEIGLRTGVYDSVQVVPLLGAARATKLIPVAINRENAEVLMALRQITENNFGFDEKAWQRWWNVDRSQTTLAPDLH
ncbi:MAG: HEAT repeat domain-containing protein [Planctomycetaceae bacterium]|nr:HEAT repeat domain-containing protein [Planctomycetaceae bacterium]